MTNIQDTAGTDRKVIRCYVYARTARSNPLAVERQVQDGRGLAETLTTSAVEYQVVRVFEDAGLSGYSGRRPGYEEMLAGLEHGEATVVLVSDEARLYRNEADEKAYSELSDRLAVATYSAQAGRISR